MTFFIIIGAWIALSILSVVAQRAAYRNGVRDGLFNPFLPAVREIKEQEGRKYQCW